MDLRFLYKSWDKWASAEIGCSGGQPLKAALLINYDPAAHSRLLSTIVKQEGINILPIHLNRFIDIVKRNKIESEIFSVGQNEYLTTSIHENWFGGRCLNTSNPQGEGVIVMKIAAFLLIALYDGAYGCSAMAAVDRLTEVLKKNQRK